MFANKTDFKLLELLNIWMIELICLILLFFLAIFISVFSPGFFLFFHIVCNTVSKRGMFIRPGLDQNNEFSFQVVSPNFAVNLNRRFIATHKIFKVMLVKVSSQTTII